MTTEKIYDANPRLLTFEAKVLSCTPAPKKGYDIVLDRTAFFPEGGGQKCDRGTLRLLSDTASASAHAQTSAIPVSDVQIKEDVIHHVVSEPFAEGSTVSGQIDWGHRFDNMQQHSESILSPVL